MIPDFQTLMLPVLKFVADGKEHKYTEFSERIVEEFNLTDDEKKEMVASGKQTIFENRIGWAILYLKKAGLIESKNRSFRSITELGQQVLSKKPSRIDVNYLKQFPMYTQWISDSNKSSQTSINDDVHTPEEDLENAYQNLRKSLAYDLLNRVLDLSSTFFERLVVELLVKMGYGGSIKDAGRAIGKTGDEGIDGIIKEDKLGLDVIYIQAKRWKQGTPVGRPEIQKFVGALAGQGAKKGIFITTSCFTKEAMDYAPRNETKIVLIDGEQLAQLMIDYDLGCTTQQTYELKRIDIDYFEEE